MNEARLSPEAAEDLEEIWHYIAQKGSAESARRWTKRISRRTRLLAQNPSSGVPCEELEPQSRRIAEGEYVIYYKPTDYGAVISRVIHGRRDQRRALDREDKS